MADLQPELGLRISGPKGKKKKGLAKGKIFQSVKTKVKKRQKKINSFLEEMNKKLSQGN